nr:MAG TPA: hypothetical protein [Caudoviricetes sp.]
MSYAKDILPFLISSLYRLFLKLYLFSGLNTIVGLLFGLPALCFTGCLDLLICDILALCLVDYDLFVVATFLVRFVTVVGDAVTIVLTFLVFLRLGFLETRPSYLFLTLLSNLRILPALIRLMSLIPFNFASYSTVIPLARAI